MSVTRNVYMNRQDDDDSDSSSSEDDGPEMKVKSEGAVKVSLG